MAVKVHDNGAPRYFDCGLSVEIDVTLGAGAEDASGTNRFFKLVIE